MRTLGFARAAWLLPLLLLSAGAVPALAQEPPEIQVEYVWLLPGTPLYLNLEARGEPAVVTREIAYLPLLERSGERVRVQYLGSVLWTAAEAASLDERKKRPVAPDSPAFRLRDAEVEARARLLPKGQIIWQSGPFTVVTDVDDEPLRHFLDGLSWQIGPAYEARYGLPVSFEADGPTIYLLAREEDYRAFARSGARLELRDTSGEASHNTVVTFVGTRTRWQVGAELIHQVIHLLNRRSFSSPLPTFLEEGMAEDLACFWAEDPLAPAPAFFGARSLEQSKPILPCHQWLHEASKEVTELRLRPFSALEALTRTNFHATADFSANQLTSRSLVRSLLDDDHAGERVRAPRLRAFLAAAAAGQPSKAGALLSELGLSATELQAGVGAFVSRTIQRYASGFDADLGSREGAALLHASAGRSEPARWNPGWVPPVPVERDSTGLPTRYTYVWLLPGSPLHESPEAPAPKLALRHLSYLPIVERRPGWLAVQREGERLWVDETTAHAADPPDKKAKWSWVTQYPDAETMEIARQLAGSKDANVTLGPFRTFTDVTDEAMLARLDSAASAIEAAYEARFGISIRSRSSEAVLLYGNRSMLSEVNSKRPNVDGRDPGGFAPLGAAHVGIETHSRWDVVATLLHELTHTLNHRRLHSLPTWLQEGLATDLGCAWVEDPTSLAPGLIGADRGAKKIDALDSCYSWMLQLEHKPETLLPFLPTAQLLTLDYKSFHAKDFRSRNYAHSFFLVRYLLDGENGAHNESFRQFLQDIAKGRTASPKLLEKRIGRTVAEIEKGLGAYILAEVERHQPLLTPNWQRTAPTPLSE